MLYVLQARVEFTIELRAEKEPGADTHFDKRHFPREFGFLSEEFQEVIDDGSSVL